MLYGLPLSMVHNPLAAIRIPEGLLQANGEYLEGRSASSK
jgi:hypothetical protein